MKVQVISTSALVCLLGLFSYADAAKNSLTVHINNNSDYCFILPKNKDTIGNAERPGGMKSYCTKPVKGQGSLDPSFFTKGPYIKTGTKHGPYKQITGCINPKKAPTLISSDDGGQVDSNGGDGGHGNPAGSACAGYASYVSIIEPSGHTICLRCCQDPRDCPTNDDTNGCAAIIKGKYC